MIVAFTLFIVSFAGIVVMLAISLHKINTGKSFVLFRYGDKLELYLKQKGKDMKTTLSFFNRKTARLLFHFVLDKIEEKAVKLKDAGHKKAKKLIERARAKETKIKRTEKASEFIEKVKEIKEEGY
jgi:hypothetical protein